MHENTKIDLVIYFFAIAFSCIAAKLVFIAKHGSKTRINVLNMPVQRGNIYDRNMNLLATNIPTVSAYIKPEEFILEIEESCGKINKIFPYIKIIELKKKVLLSKNFIWLKRHLTPNQKRVLMDLGIPGLYLLDTQRRVYPDKNLFSHVLGGTDIDNHGIAGIEKYFEKKLSENNEDIQLSLDIRIQHIVRDELLLGMKKFSAVGAVGIVMNIKNGEILSMVSLPDFDLNNIKNKSAIFNQATFALFEPGSVAKIFNIALALECKAVTLNTQFDISKPIRIGRFTIHDFKSRSGLFSVKDIFKFSSNIGSAKIAQEIGKERQRNFLKSLGLFEKLNIELLECQKPIVPKIWHDSTLLTISYGHGIAVTPLHIIRAIAGILNNGEMQYPTLLIRNYIESTSVISKETSEKIRMVMREIVNETSGKLANIKGYAVVGKTGTSEKTKKGGYKKAENVCFFVAEFNKYILLVMLDDPKALPSTYGFRSANWNAASVAGEIIRRIGPILNVIPNKF